MNDYQKYGLLRILAGNGEFKIGVCWMLTTNDNRTDGKLTSYLNVPQYWRLYDPPLFDILQQRVIAEKNRNVDVAQVDQIIPNAEFYSEILSDSMMNRNKYFEQAVPKFKSCNLIFYDPDNGVEIKSVAKGKRNSAKYIYWDEVCQTFGNGHSLLVYQHFPHVERKTFIEERMREYKVRLNAVEVYCFQTTRVAYFLAIQEKHKELINSKLELVLTKWNSQIQIYKQI